ncbi:MAG: Clp protease N-terminal domain-containing protein [Actinobacteria bacterium]|nr:Clp protease N-terminal domain-containing protein [Actinomycetota bacterium]
MFDKLRRARADLATMNQLLPDAERRAREDGLELPGAEHLLLASLDLDDIAAGVLRGFSVDGADLRAAVAGQHDEALRTIGLLADDNAIEAALPPGGQPRGPYRSQGSLQRAFQHAVELAKRDGSSVNSGHVLLAVTEAEHGTVARALGHLGVDPDLLREQTRRALETAPSGAGG